MEDESRIQQLLEEMLQDSGPLEEVCRDFPELMPEVRRRWERLRRVEFQIEALFPSSASGRAAARAPAGVETSLPQIPGYEVQSILGHGGMGVVYKARHLKLNRAVALKMVLAGAFASPSERQRLVREAQAIAALCHSNIVMVHDVGEFEGRPYFTMELVDGGSLARKLAGTPQPTVEAAALVAKLADAMHSAHKAGIVHRDLKPANVLLAADGTPKITDFGLARHFESDDALTLTGARIGTPSYMAPEQAAGRRSAGGPLVDIYALGALLYEMLTGRPPFRGENAVETQRQVIDQDPAPPSRLNSRTPRDLETICLKCLEKDPQRRYASAGELADDLHRFVRGEPIQARPIGTAGRLLKWLQRRPGQAAIVLAILLSLLVLVSTVFWWSGRRVATARAVERDLSEMTQYNVAGDWPAARTALERAKARVGEFAADPLRHRVEQAQRDLDLVARLDRIRLNRAIVVGVRLDPHANRAQADREYTEAYQTAGLIDTPENAAQRIRSSAVAKALVAALDDWAVCVSDPTRRVWLLEVAGQADSGVTPWRRRVRDPAGWADAATLSELVQSAPIETETVQLLAALAERLRNAEGDSVPFLTRVQAAHPGDFWANTALGDALFLKDDVEKAASFYQAALALRPDSVVACNNLGFALARGGHLEAAIEQLSRAIRIDPGFSPAYSSLGNCHKLSGRYAEAIELHRRAIEIDPQNPVPHQNLGVTLADSGRLPEAIEHYRIAIRLSPTFANAYYTLGNALHDTGQFAEAIEQFGEALRLDPKLADAHNSLGRTLNQVGRMDEAIEHLKRAIALDSRNAIARTNLGVAYMVKGRLDEAVDLLQEAVRIDPQLIQAHGGLGQVLIAAGRYREAIVANRAALALATPDSPLHQHALDQLKISERKFALESRLPAILASRQKPANPLEAFEFAEMCYRRRCFVAAARLAADALSTEPQLAADPRTGRRYNAACYASLAGAGSGEDAAELDDPQRAAWRSRARGWLREDLALLRDARKDPAYDGQFTLQSLSNWKRDADLAGVRDREPLADLPQSERDDCRLLWAEVDRELSALNPSNR